MKEDLRQNEAITKITEEELNEIEEIARKKDLFWKKMVKRYFLDTKTIAYYIDHNTRELRKK